MKMTVTLMMIFYVTSSSLVCHSLAVVNGILVNGGLSVSDEVAETSEDSVLKN
jgi:hypothetical protein